jgi:hypothetical protein
LPEKTAGGVSEQVHAEVEKCMEELEKNKRADE